MGVGSMESKKLRGSFSGGMLGCLGINIVVFLLTLITLGIGTPWALCIKKRWEIKHTQYGGRQLVFDGRGHQLLGNTLKWFFLTIITLGIFVFWWGIKLRRWYIKHIYFEDTKQPVSTFTGTAAEELGINIFGGIVYAVVGVIFVAVITIPMLLTLTGLLVESLEAFELSAFFAEDVDLTTKFEEFFTAIGDTIEEGFEDFSLGDTNLIMLLLVLILSVFMGLGLASMFVAPALICMERRWVCKNTYINGNKMHFEGKGIALFGKYWLWTLLTIVTLGIFGLWVEVKELRWFAQRTVVNGKCASSGNGVVSGDGSVSNVSTRYGALATGNAGNAPAYNIALYIPSASVVPYAGQQVQQQIQAQGISQYPNVK